MKEDKYFEGKVVLITGAGSGIGKSIANQILNFSPEKLILVDLNENSLQKLKENNSNVEVYTVDVSSEEQMRELFEKTIQVNTKIDIVFNNAGIAFGGDFKDYSFNDWEKIININIWGVIYGTSFAYKKMIVQQFGQIVNIASLGGLIPEPMASAYSTTKHAVVGLTTTLREEASMYNIKVNVACPGVVNTPIYDTATFVGNVDKDKVKNATLEHGAISSDLCAKRIIKGVIKNKGIILVKSMDKILWKIYRLSPSIMSPLNRFIAKYFKNNFGKD